jgi:hypothetical protein
MKKLSLSVLLLAVGLGLFAAHNVSLIDVPEAHKEVRQAGPYNLMAVVIGNDAVLLAWENPVYEEPPLGFRIYCNDCLVRFAPGSDVADYLLQEVCEGCHQFFVTAYFDSDCESLPSNIAEVNVTSVSDNVISEVPLFLKTYPNPVRGMVNISLEGVKDGGSPDISVYNVKGQLIKRFHLSTDRFGQWNCRDSTGRQATEGIYFLKATTPQGSVTQKIILVR